MHVSLLIPGYWERSYSGEDMSKIMSTSSGISAFDAVLVSMLDVYRDWVLISCNCSDRS